MLLLQAGGCTERVWVQTFVWDIIGPACDNVVSLKKWNAKGSGCCPVLGSRQAIVACSGGRAHLRSGFTASCSLDSKFPLSPRCRREWKGTWISRRYQRVAYSRASVNKLESVDGSILTGDGSEMQNTLRLVECAMFAATAGLAYFLSNLLRLEGYFGCFFPLPVVISSMRWGATGGKKTMVATAILLLVLSGPLKAASYLLMHGFVGLAMGSIWSWQWNWVLSIVICTVVRCFGALGFVILSSWLLRDNLLALITINAHASIAYMLAALGINLVPTMSMIYFIFAALLFINCGSFVFLLHVLYAIFLRRLGIKMSISLPGWVERAM